MNRNCYRLVFNTTAGMMVPLAEIARGRGKAASNTVLVGALIASVVLANVAQAATLQALAQALAAIVGCPFGVLGAAANSVGGYVAGCVPTGKTSGINAKQMIEAPLKAYLLLGVEPELDMHNPRQAITAMKQAELVVALSPFQHGATEYANVLLPIAPFTETAGTFVSTEGRVQTFAGVVKPLGETRPAWKVLRVLGNLLGLSGFEHDSAEDAQREALHGKSEIFNKNNSLNVTIGALPNAAAGLLRIAETPIYAADALARRAPSLQQTRDALPPVATMTRSNSSTEPLPRVSLKVSPSLTAERTAVEVRMFTPVRAAADMRQSTMVAESSVVGNMRPSSSVFVATPRVPNHSIVSRGWKRWKAPSSSRPPRGYFFTSSAGSKQECVTLQRPPPEMRTFASGCAVAS